ncbi:MAG: hydrolase [Clostridia bacterium]|nr:hydrolase [Clostridia bacterium]
MDTIANKRIFIDIYNEKIKREGRDALLEYLNKSDFFIAPASSKFHSNIDGGLCAHSINVYNRLKGLVEHFKLSGCDIDVSDESIAICGLLHDLCKVNFYAVEFRNVKIDGKWEKAPYYTIRDSLPYGHGEKSVYIINGYMRLTREEALAINWHMGAFDNRVKAGDYSISGAYKSYPLAMLTHMADMAATYLDEEIY